MFCLFIMNPSLIWNYSYDIRIPNILLSGNDDYIYIIENGIKTQ